jgi:nucleoside-diphosphate-sugar epimerase
MPSVAHGKFSGRRLVVFGCGYIGRAVADHILSEGGSVTAVVRQNASAAALRASGIGGVVGDVATATWHDALPGPVDFVLNSLSPGLSGVEEYRRTYLQGMQSIVEWARKTGAPGTFVYTGSTSVYPQDGGVVVGETAATGASTEQAGVLLETEEVLRRSHDACARWFILRLAGIYGPGRHYLLSQISQGNVAGKGEHHLNLAYREDIVAAISACFAAPHQVTNEIFNVVDDEPTPKKHVVAWLAARLGVPEPAFTGVPASGRRAVTPDRVVANVKLKSVLGWSPRFPSFREGYTAILEDRAG